MIEKIDIGNFGSFCDFKWDTIRDKGNNVAKLKKLNIIYGKNYSGKTTLSRILRSLETGQFPEKYEKPSFTVATTNGGISETQIPTDKYTIRVYNKDFIDDHLGFLRDKNGKITPFAILGIENKELESQIEENENKLGNVEDKTGLKHKHAEKILEAKTKQRVRDAADKDLLLKLQNKANQHPSGIKHNPLYKDVNYDIRKLKVDIDTIGKKAVEALTTSEKDQLILLLNEKPLLNITKNLTFTPMVTALHSAATQVLSKKITPTKPIQELLNDSLLQAWVKQGIPLHKDKRQVCGFCGNSITDDLWGKLDEHFSKESKDLEVEIYEVIEQIKKEQALVSSVITVGESDFYSIYHKQFQMLSKELSIELNKYAAFLSEVTSVLIARVNDIFGNYTLPAYQNNFDSISNNIAQINGLIQENNKRTESLDRDQGQARNQLRLAEIAQFMKDIDLAKEEQKILNHQKEVESINGEAAEIGSQIEQLEKETELLKSKLKDEKKGAEKVNEYLNHYFGHGGLQLQAVEDLVTSSFKFQILRGGTPAYNLSEGECSLVAFCYFMAKLEDIETKGKKPIIFIDDPISSLDSNHVFFVFSLIESLIAKPEEDATGNIIKDATDKPVYRYEQLFLSTHNLDFLKYLKKLSKPGKEHEHFIVVSTSKGSLLDLMPNYLRMYVTELNYLFGEIYLCSDPTNSATKEHCFYNFGNNLRKFLEAFLFFKYPFAISDRSDYDKRIKDFFKDEPFTEPLVQRLTNEFSHLGEILDRSIQPVDHAEIARLAKFVLKKIRDNDKAQFKCFLQSIEKPDPFDE